MRKSERQLHFRSWKTLSDADVWDSLDIFHEWITIDFCDKLSHGNLRVSGGGQVNRYRTGKMSLRKISGKWPSAGTRLKRLQRTGGIMSPNVSLTWDEPGTRNTWNLPLLLSHIVYLHPTYYQGSKTYLSFLVISRVQHLDCHHYSPHLVHS